MDDSPPSMKASLMRKMLSRSGMSSLSPPTSQTLASNFIDVLIPHQHNEEQQVQTVSEPVVVETKRQRFYRRTNKKDAIMKTIEGRQKELEEYYSHEKWWSFYRFFCQFRFGYFSFLVLIVILMFSFTLLMEIFFAIFLPSAKFDQYYMVRAIILLFLLPIILIFLSYWFEEGTRLFFDAIDRREGSLPHFRLALAVVIHYLRNYQAMQDIVDSETSTTTTTSATPIARTGQDESTTLAFGSFSSERKRTSKLLITSVEDPFNDDDKEEEDLEVIQREELKLGEIDLSSVRDSIRTPMPKDPRLRWKRAKALISAALMIRRIQTDIPEIDYSTHVIVDLVCPVLFEIVTITVFILTLLATWSPCDAFLAYIRCGFYFLGSYLLIWMITHFWSSRNPKMRSLVSHYRRKHRMTIRAVKTLEKKRQSRNLWLLDVGYRFYRTAERNVSPVRYFKRFCGGSKKKNTSSDKEFEQKNLHDVELGVLATELPMRQTISSSSNVLSSSKLSPRTPSKVSRQEETVENLKKEVAKKKMQRLREAKANFDSWNPYRKLSLNMKLVILFIFVSLAAMLSLASFMLGWPLMGLGLILLSSTIQQRFPQVFGPAFRHFITAFVVMSLVFFSSTWIIGTFVIGGEFKLDPPPSDFKYNSSASIFIPPEKMGAWEQLAHYPSCSIDYRTLTIIDFALIADAAYGVNTTIQKEALTNRFNGTQLQDWEYVARNNETSDHQVWMEIFFPPINMTVIAVRGTASATDALEDLHYWFGITIIQALNVFFPFLKQLPRQFVVNLLSMEHITSFMPDPVYAPLVEHVEKVKERIGENLVITGHSLGGAMAAMVGAKTKTPAISFSGPGLLYSRGRFRIQEEDIRNYVLTIKPMRDIVPRVDELGGMVQEIQCRKANPMACHGTFTHLCELYASCGDARGRVWSDNTQCKKYLETIEVSS